MNLFTYLFTASRNPFPATNLGTFAAGMLTGSPVLGLRPSLAFLSDAMKVPNPVKVTLSLPFTAFTIVLIVTSITFPTSILVKLVSSAIWLISSVLVVNIPLLASN